MVVNSDKTEIMWIGWKPVDMKHIAVTNQKLNFLALKLREEIEVTEYWNDSITLKVSIKYYKIGSFLVTS